MMEDFIKKMAEQAEEEKMKKLMTDEERRWNAVRNVSAAYFKGMMDSAADKIVQVDSKGGLVIGETAGFVKAALVAAREMAEATVDADEEIDKAVDALRNTLKERMKNER